MKYLTKEWCELCQQMDLGACEEMHELADRFCEVTYQQLYKEKEEEFVSMQKRVCEANPQIEVFKEYYGDPFSVEKCKANFKSMQDDICKRNKESIPRELYCQIADPRVLALGYGTESIIEQLLAIGNKNKKLVHETLQACSRDMKSQSIPEALLSRFGFHDCEVVSYEEGEDFIMNLDTSGGFTDDNKIIFRDAKIIEFEAALTGSFLLYEELYRCNEGYEAHILYWNERNRDLIIRCRDIEILTI